MFRALKGATAGAMALTTALIVSGCESNPPLAPEEGDLIVDLAVAALGGDPGPVAHAHVHTLGEMSFHVHVRDHHGHHVTGFDTIRVEHRRHGTDAWRTAVNLHLHGETFTGGYEYVTSGGYDLRVSGMRHGHGHMASLHHEHDPLDVARAHKTVGDLRIEFESFPGHIHTGEDTAVRFWVMEAAADGHGHRPPVAGLTATIHCGEADGSMEAHQAVEAEPGVYEAIHRFDTAGRAHATIRITTPDGTEVEAGFEPPVAATH